jgi:hypothetical protein
MEDNSKLIDKEEIKQQSHKLLAKFSKSLDLIIKKGGAKKFQESSEGIEREKQTRQEKSGEDDKSLEDSGFRKIMFKNAPNSDGNLIFGEKKKW